MIVVIEHELLIQFESIVDAKENEYDVKDCIVQQCTFKEKLYQQHLVKASLERKYVSTYMYGWKLGNYDNNPSISIPSSAIHTRIQTILKWVYLKKQTSYFVHYMHIRKELHHNCGVNLTF